MLRSDVINCLIKRYGLKSYLEIGTRNRSDNFNLISVEHKICIDPDINALADFVLTSDEWFENHANTFDIIFIDGLHKSFQVKKDIENSLRHLNKHGVVVLHDCNPTSFEMQIRDVDFINEWTGDVWKAYVNYRKNSEFFTCVVDADYGCGIIDTNKVTSKPKISISDDFDLIEYRQLEAERVGLLNLISVEDFLKMYMTA